MRYHYAAPGITIFIPVYEEKQKGGSDFMWKSHDSMARRTP
jgi:hypothetical protein